MSIERYFESGEESLAKGHFANLIKIANADGVIDEKEEKLLHRLAKNFGITDREFNEMINHESEYSFIPPVSKVERYERFVNLLRVVVADEDVSDFEMVALRRLAAGMDMPLKNMDTTVDNIIEAILSKTDIDTIVEQMDSWLKG